MNCSVVTVSLIPSSFQIAMTETTEALFVINIPPNTRGRGRSKVGYIDQRGLIKVKPDFDDGLDFTDGLACIKIGKKWGFIDTTGSVVIDPKYAEFSRFQEGFAEVRINHKWGFINKIEDLVIDFRYEMTGSFSEGVCH